MSLRPGGIPLFEAQMYVRKDRTKDALEVYRALALGPLRCVCVWVKFSKLSRSRYIVTSSNTGKDSKISYHYFKHLVFLSIWCCYVDRSPDLMHGAQGLG